VLSKLFRWKRKGKPAEDTEDPRRRQHLRHPCEIPLQARCSSWDSFHALFSGNISERGLFIPTDRVATLKEPIAVEVTAPDKNLLKLTGVVVHVFRGPDGAQRGLGIRLDELSGEALRRYRALVVEAARQCLPQLPPRAAPTPRPRPAQKVVGTTGVYAVDIPSGASDELAAPPSTPPEEPAYIDDEVPIFEEAEGDSPAEVARGETVPIGEGIRLRDGAPPPIPPPPPGSIRARAPAEPVVGIDFGTSMSSVAVVVKNEVSVVQTPDGRRDLPSVVGFLEDGRAVIGHEARQLMLADPRCVIASPKRLLGRAYEDREIEPFLATLALPHSKGPDGEVLLHPHGRALTVPQVCAPLLREMRRLAEHHLGQPVRRAVLTAPVSFEPRRLTALREVARLAGLEVLRVVDEPTAAALSYRFDTCFRKLCAVYDFGGGTFDFSVVDVSAADLQVVTTAGDSWLGGDDFDEALAAAAANAFWRETSIELRHQVVQWQRLRLAAEATKRELSWKQDAVLELESAALTAAGPRQLRFPITRAQFADLSAPIIERSLDTCREALELAGVAASELSAVFLSGGTSYVPAVRVAVERAFGKPGRVAVPPERAVVIGAAIYAAQALGSQITPQ
jgi:actin-like ATPase involved in cell morphogenesis